METPQLLPRSTRSVRNCTSDDGKYLHLFFSYKEKQKEQAKELCQTCPVQLQCYQVAVANGEIFGVWGGVDFSQSVTRPSVFNPTREPFEKVEKVAYA